MLIAVLHPRIQRLLRSLFRISVFGDGLLERARSTSFALFGGIAAIGLAIVAFALQLGWPIGVDRPLPNAPPKQRQAVGAAVVVASPPSHPAAARRNHGRGAVGGRAVEPEVEPAASSPHGGSDLVVSNSEPAPSPPSHPHPQGHQNAPQGQPAPAPQGSQPPQAPVAAQGAPGVSKPEPQSQPEPAPVPQPEPAPEPEAESSSVPGNGNAYGKGNGNGPPAPPPAVGNPHSSEAESSLGHPWEAESADHSGETPCHADD